MMLRVRCIDNEEHAYAEAAILFSSLRVSSVLTVTLVRVHGATHLAAEVEKVISVIGVRA